MTCAPRATSPRQTRLPRPPPAPVTRTVRSRIDWLNIRRCDPSIGCVSANSQDLSSRSRVSSSMDDLLANVRVARPCKERWADMAGDDRVRFCNGCERQVFNLSEMTREEAEALLATRGVKPCV